MNMLQNRPEFGVIRVRDFFVKKKLYNMTRPLADKSRIFETLCSEGAISL